MGLAFWRTFWYDSIFEWIPLNTCWALSERRTFSLLDLVEFRKDLFVAKLSNWSFLHPRQVIFNFRSIIQHLFTAYLIGKIDYLIKHSCLNIDTLYACYINSAYSEKTNFCDIILTRSSAVVLAFPCETDQVKCNLRVWQYSGFLGHLLVLFWGYKSVQFEFHIYTNWLIQGSFLLELFMMLLFS